MDRGVAVVANQDVVAVSAHESVGPQAATQGVIAVAPAQGVVVVRAGQLTRGLRTRNRHRRAVRERPLIVPARTHRPGRAAGAAPGQRDGHACTARRLDLDLPESVAPVHALGPRHRAARCRQRRVAQRLVADPDRFR